MTAAVQRVVWLTVAALLFAEAALAQANPDEPAAIVVYPYVVVDAATSTDTLIQLSNISDMPVELRCFYEDFTPQCTNGQPGETCFPEAITCSGFCIPREARIPLRVRATAKQPLAWQASAGLASLPLDGVARSGPDGATNQFSDVPGLGAGPFVGTLRCVAMTDDPYRPSSDNVLVGQATIERQLFAYADAAQYRAIGVKALPGGADRDEFLFLGGAGAEYEACPGVNLLDHYFDGAPVSDASATTSTTLVLASCSAQLPLTTDTVAQFLSFNEFGQRFSTSRSFHGQFVVPLSEIDTRTPERSIFWYAVTGTLTGRTVINGIGVARGGGGLHAVAIESHRSTSLPDRVQSDAINAHSAGAQLGGDVLTFRPPRCSGDCDFDGEVTIDELILGVNMALGTTPIEACPPFDANLDLEVTIDELIAAVNAALTGCPDPVAPPTPVTTPAPTPTASASPSAGPPITHLGVATADERPLLPDATDVMGRPVFVRPFGQGLTLVIEARPGQSRSPVGRSAYSPAPAGDLPDLQVLVSRPLGDGNPVVCEQDGHSGGIPAVPNLDFTPQPATVAAINDLGCRAFDLQPSGNTPCTRTPAGTFANVNSLSTIQFCIPIAKAWAFPVGDTIVAARMRDVAGNLGPVREMVVHINE